MKKFILAALVLCTSAVYAADVVVMDEPIQLMSNNFATVDARFHMDQTTGEGFVKVTVTEERMTYGGGMCDHYGRCYPQRMPMPYVIFEESAKIDGLMLMDDKVIFHGAEGDVDCGKMGVSRVFKKPTIFLNGNCKLSGRVSGRFNDSKVVVVLKTK